VHHTVNIVAIALCFSGASILQQGIASWIATDRVSVALGFLLVILFQVVQWNFQQSKKIVLSTKTRNFEECLASGLNRMQALHLQLCLFRYLMVATYVAKLYLDYIEDQ
jgi:hypothetical protein